jgi:hypothetical protein
MLWGDEDEGAAAWVREEFEYFWAQGVDLPDAVIQHVAAMANRVEYRSIEPCGIWLVQLRQMPFSPSGRSIRAARFCAPGRSSSRPASRIGSSMARRTILSPTMCRSRQDTFDGRRRTGAVVSRRQAGADPCSGDAGLAMARGARGQEVLGPRFDELGQDVRREFLRCSIISPSNAIQSPVVSFAEHGQCWKIKAY